jgi:hypothetical protein
LVPGLAAGSLFDAVERGFSFPELLSEQLDAYRQRASVPGVVRSGIRIDPQIADKLRALGYLQ